MLAAQCCATLSTRAMTRPKKWFMDYSDGPGKDVVLKNADGPIKKPNASQPLGRVSNVTVAESDSSKYPQSVLVSYVNSSSGCGKRCVGV